MIVNTKDLAIEFGHTAHSQNKKDDKQITVVNNQGRSVIIKMIRKESDDGSFSYYRKVNFTDKKMREAYRKLNKMLGGN